jgi:hypothetical protein
MEDKVFDPNNYFDKRSRCNLKKTCIEDDIERCLSTCQCYCHEITYYVYCGDAYCGEFGDSCPHEYNKNQIECINAICNKYAGFHDDVFCSVKCMEEYIPTLCKKCNIQLNEKNRNLCIKCNDEYYKLYKKLKNINYVLHKCKICREREPISKFIENVSVCQKCYDSYYNIIEQMKEFE